jgi:hypothetical protein
VRLKERISLQAIIVPEDVRVGETARCGTEHDLFVGIDVVGSRHDHPE